MLPLIVSGQNLLRNGSFELDDPWIGIEPRYWLSCEGNPTHLPDVLSDVTPNFFRLDHQAAEGHQYLALAARSNNTYESIGQKLNLRGTEGQTLGLSFSVARADTLISRDRLTLERVNFNQPIRVEVWLGKKRCRRDRLVGSTELVAHADWQQVAFEFPVDPEYRWLIIQSRPDPARARAYNGHVLLDDFRLEIR